MYLESKFNSGLQMCCLAPCSTIVCSMYMYMPLSTISQFSSLHFTPVHSSLPPFFVLFNLSPHLVTLVALLSLSYHHLCSYLLIRNDNASIILSSSIDFTLHYPLCLNGVGVDDQSGDGVFDHSGRMFLTNGLTYSDSWTILFTWLKQSSESCGFRLTSSSAIVHQTRWLLYFSTRLTAQNLIWMPHYMLKNRSLWSIMYWRKESGMSKIP